MYFTGRYRMKIFSRLYFIIYIMVFAGLSINSLTSAPDTGTGKTSVKTPVKKAVPAVEKKTEPVTEKTVSENEASHYQPASGNLVTIGGGYYMPLGEMGTYLKPSWSVKVTYQDNRKGGSPIGFGADLVYSYPPDKEVDGGMIIITAAPHATLTMPFFEAADLQFKAGPGLTVFNSVLETGSNVSGDMTLHCGANISRVFAGVFYMGIGTDFYYIFERKNLRTLNSWFSMGYRW